MIPSRDSEHCTPASIAAANEWHAANGELDALHERERKYGRDAVSTDEFISARQRLDTATTNIVIPDHLLTFTDRGRHPTNPLGQQEQWRQAQDSWATAHRWDRGQFERLREIQLDKRKPTRRNRRGG